MPNKFLSQEGFLAASMAAVLGCFSGSGLLALLLVLALCPFTSADAKIHRQERSDFGSRQGILANWTDQKLYPVYGEMAVRNMSSMRRKLGTFQICALCTCCGGQNKLCFPSPCCYSINCNLPNRPFGFCSFSPKSCNCLDCHL